MNTYQLIDSGNGQKWERFGPYVLCRPCPQAVWRPTKKVEADAVFSREGGNQWTYKKQLPREWDIVLRGVRLKISLTDFGHLGVFPEHSSLWDWMRPLIGKGDQVLNLFAYSGGASLAAAQTGSEVCHLDASKGMVDWARENCALNQLQAAPIRWIVDDAIKFLQREEKRGRKYEGIILDPPTFGRGGKGEIFKIEEEIIPLLELCKRVLSDRPKFVIFSCHTPGFTPIVLEHLLFQVFGKRAESGEMLLISADTFAIASKPSGRSRYEILAKTSGVHSRTSPPHFLMSSSFFSPKNNSGQMSNVWIFRPASNPTEKSALGKRPNAQNLLKKFLALLLAKRCPIRVATVFYRSTDCPLPAKNLS